MPLSVVQVSSLSAQLLALTAERDQLRDRCQREGSSSSSIQQQLQEQVISLTGTCRAKDQEVAHVNVCLQHERRERVRWGPWLAWGPWLPCLLSRFGCDGLKIHVEQNGKERERLRI
jgi:hypothetical protein